MLNNVAKIVLKPIPRMHSPKAHSIADFVVVGSFFAGAALFWQPSERASIAALVCGAAELAVSRLTDYPGGIKKVIAFRAHRDIDLGLAAMTAMMPEFLAFEDESEKKFFLAQEGLITAITELTQFPEKPQPAEKGTKPSKAA
jgi:hypothetical protein